MKVDPTRACPDQSAVSRVGSGLYCTTCAHAVLDLRHVTEKQAEARIREARLEGGTVCAQLFTDESGYPSYLVDPPTPRRSLRIAPMALAATFLAACSSKPVSHRPVASARTVVGASAKVATDAGAAGRDARAVRPDAGSPAVGPTESPDAGHQGCVAPDDDAGVGSDAPRRGRRGHVPPATGRRTRHPAQEYAGLLELDLLKRARFRRRA